MAESTGIYAQFSIEPVEQSFLSQKEGRPIFADREFVRIVIAGDKHTEVFREATEHDKERFHEPYERFKRGMKDRDQITGTPLSQWPQLGVSQVKEYEALNIFTVEALAALSDTMKQKIGMGANENVAAARAFLESAKDGAALASYAAENERLRNDLEILREQVKVLADRLEAVSEDEPAPRRRKSSRETMLEL